MGVGVGFRSGARLDGEVGDTHKAFRLWLG